MYEIFRDGKSVFQHSDMQEIAKVFFNFYTFAHRENTQANNDIIAGTLNQLAEDTKTNIVITKE